MFATVITLANNYNKINERNTNLLLDYHYLLSDMFLLFKIWTQVSTPTILNRLIKRKWSKNIHFSKGLFIFIAF